MAVAESGLLDHLCMRGSSRCCPSQWPQRSHLLWRRGLKDEGLGRRWLNQAGIRPVACRYNAGPLPVRYLCEAFCSGCSRWQRSLTACRLALALRRSRTLSEAF
jgi:hypothetical protein